MTRVDDGFQFTNEKYFFQYGREEQLGSLQTPSLICKNRDSLAAIIQNLVSFKLQNSHVVDSVIDLSS